MNNSRNINDDASCEARAQDISLFAAGCLTAQEEQALQMHLATCDVCRARCEQLQTLCSDLRAAKPECATTRFEMHVEQNLADSPRVTQLVTKDTSQSRLALIAAVVASVLVTLGLLAVSGRRTALETPSRVIDIAKGTQSQGVPDALSNRVEQPAAQPTLFALRQAAAVSEDALDQLMAQSSVSMFSQPISAHSHWSER